MWYGLGFLFSQRPRFISSLFYCLLLTSSAFAQSARALPDTALGWRPLPLSAFVLTDSTLATAPFRGVNAAVARVPGVVELDGNLHMRGGRAGEIGFYVNGMAVNRAVGGANGLPLIHNAIESVTVYSGDVPIKYGGHLSGAVETRLKIGGDKLKLTGEIVSDDFWAVKDSRGAYEILGIDELYSFGYNDYVLTLGGPVHKTGNRLRFFIAGQSWNRASGATRFAGFDQDHYPLIQNFTDRDLNVVIDTLDLYIHAPAGRLPSGRDRGWRFNGNLLFKAENYNIRWDVLAASSLDRASTADPREMLNIHRGLEQESEQVQSTLRVQFKPMAGMNLDVSLGYWRHRYENRDPVLGDEWKRWGYPADNAALLDLSKPRHFTFFDITGPFPDTPPEQYSKGEEQRWSGRVVGTYDINRLHRLHFGGDFSLGTVRYYAIDGLYYAKRYAAVGGDPELYSPFDLYAGLLPRMVGYDWLGNKVNESMEAMSWQITEEAEWVHLQNAPLRPQRFSAYVSDQATLDALMVTAGLRVDYFDSGLDGVAHLQDLNTIWPSFATPDAEQPRTAHCKNMFLSPSISAVLAMNSGLQLHAHLNQSHQAPDPYWQWIAQTEHIINRNSFAYHHLPYANPNLKPQRVTNLEMGLNWEAAAGMDVGASIYYRKTEDQLGLRNVMPEWSGSRALTVVENSEHGRVKGLRLEMRYHDFSHAHFSASYTLQHAEGTASHPMSHWGEAFFADTPSYTDQPYALDFDVRHQFKIMAGGHTSAGSGPRFLGLYPLANLFFNGYFQARSGTSYTVEYWAEMGSSAPPQPGPVNGARLPWFHQLDLTIGRRFSVGPVGLEVYLWVINALNAKSVVDVYPQTGRPESDGWLLTPVGEYMKKTRGDQWLHWYEAILTQCGSFGWQPPRQLRLGVRFEI